MRLYSAIHVGSCWTENKLKIQTNTTQKKQTTQNTAKQNYPDLVTFYDTWPENKRVTTGDNIEHWAPYN